MKRQHEAERLLAKRPIIKLTKEKAQGLIGTSLVSPPGTRPYLVRAVAFTQSPSGVSFQVKRSGKRLWVYHGMLSHYDLPLIRRALVVELDEEPQDLYVTYSIAE